MKKRIMLIAGLLIVSLGITGFGTSVSAAGKTNTEVSEEKSKDGTSGTDKDKKAAEKEESEDIDSAASFGKKAAVKETVIYDENDVKITAKSLKYGDSTADLELLLENNSKKKLTFAAEASYYYANNAVNDTMIQDGYLNVDVDAGKSASEAIKFNYDNMFLFGISEIGTIQIGFVIQDEKNSGFYTGPIEIKTSEAKSVKPSTDLFRKNVQNKQVQTTYGFALNYYSEDKIYSSDGISIITELITENKNGDRALMMEVVNDSKENAYVSLYDIKINDKLIFEGWWSVENITLKKRAVVTVAFDKEFSEDEWKKVGTKEIETIGFTVKVQNDAGKDIRDPKKVTINVK